MAEHEEHKEEHGGGGSHGGGGHGPGGGAHEEHEGAPEWLISFADNVALMMGFFVILLAMNMQKPKMGGVGGEAKMGGAPTEQMIDFVIAMRKEFNNPIDLSSDNPAEAPLRRRIRDLLEAGKSNQPGDPGPGKEHQAMQPNDVTNLGGTIQFETDSPSLNDRSRERVRAIASRIKGQRFIIEVQGHASPHEAMQNMDKAFALAYSRAISVTKELEAQGVPLANVRIVACADNERKTSREDSYDAERDQLNQRVEIVVTGQPAPGDAQLLPNKSGSAPKGSDPDAGDDEHSASSHRN